MTACHWHHYQAPADAGADPKKNLRHRGATGAIYAAAVVPFFGCHFPKLPAFWKLPNFVSGLISAIQEEVVEDRMSKFGLEKKLYLAEIRDLGELCAFSGLIHWLIQWHSRVTLGDTRKFPLIFDPFHLSDFEKWRLFGKLKASSMVHGTNWGPHPNGIRVFPPFPPLEFSVGVPDTTFPHIRTT